MFSLHAIIVGDGLYHTPGITFSARKSFHRVWYSERGVVNGVAPGGNDSGRSWPSVIIGLNTPKISKHNPLATNTRTFGSSTILLRMQGRGRLLFIQTTNWNNCSCRAWPILCEQATPVSQCLEVPGGGDNVHSYCRTHGVWYTT